MVEEPEAQQDASSAERHHNGSALRREHARITHRTIAASVGVSQSTVSLVLNGKAQGRVSPEIRAAIEAAARALGYQPHAAARALRLGRTRVLALVIPTITNPFFATVFQGAEATARARGYAVVLVDADERDEEQERLLQTLSAYALDGFVLWLPPASASLQALGSRLVLVEVEHPTLPTVLLDSAGGARAAIAHLLGLGHTHVAHLATELAHETFAVRGAAVRAALAAAGLALPSIAYARAPLDLDASRAAALTLLHQEPLPTAIFCDDDLLAAGVYKAAHDLSLAIPHDLSVVGFGGTATARLMEPELTTVAVDAAALGATAVGTLIDLLDGRPITQRVMLPIRLRKGASTTIPGR